MDNKVSRCKIIGEYVIYIDLNYYLYIVYYKEKICFFILERFSGYYFGKVIKFRMNIVDFLR